MGWTSNHSGSNLESGTTRGGRSIRLAESDGVEMHHIQQAMGHSSVRVTERYYAHFSPQSSQERVLKALQGGRKSGRG